MTRAAGLAASLAGLWLALATAAAPAQDIISARLIQPTARYDHGVLGDALEWGALRLVLADGRQITVTLPETHVFEDVAARIGDLDGDDHPEVMVVETDMARGASLAIYDATGRRVATRPIGQPHRWLAPAGWGDFDGDGRTEIAYVDRPHLVRELVFLRLEGGSLTELARLSGVTNHRIGDSSISAGLRRCSGRDSLILASADWTQVMEASLAGNRAQARILGPLRGPDDLEAARRCP